MPHISIQMYPGRDEKIKQNLALIIAETASKELNRGIEHFSVSIEDVPQNEWDEKVYKKVSNPENKNVYILHGLPTKINQTTKIREYKHEDFETIKNWINDERLFHFWCAGRFDYPINSENFEKVLDNHKKDFGGDAYVITNDDDYPTGFFVCNINHDEKNAFLKFVILNHYLRGKGNGTKMINLISDYLKTNKNISTISLNVFSENIAAKKCYEKAGFNLEKIELDKFKFKNESWERCRMKKCMLE